jgi:hypothetical protein
MLYRIAVSIRACLISCHFLVVSMYPKLKSVLVLAVSMMPIGVSAVSVQSASAATFANAYAQVKLEDFSHNPLSIDALAIHEVNSTGSAIATANEKALFCVDELACPGEAIAKNRSTSQASGTGSSDYYGFAQSQAAVAGYDFLIEKGGTFSFNFDALLRVGTSTDQQPGERAFASSNITFQIFEGDTLLDKLILSGTAEDANQTAQLSIDGSHPDFSFSSNLKSNVDRNRPARMSLKGLFSRTFENGAHISLVETKTTQAMVAVPEPTLLPALGVLLAVFGYRAYRQKTIKPLNLESGLKS